MSRIAREKVTVKLMIKYYCRQHRHTNLDTPCLECQELLDYSVVTLDKCKYQNNKPICRKCTIHCFRPAMREKITEVMKYSGPRLVLIHPLLAIQHLKDLIAPRII